VCVSVRVLATAKMDCRWSVDGESINLHNYVYLSNMQDTI
jgi:hypothetical protein